jgi:hypothetical protein
MKTILTNVVLFRVLPVLVAASFFLGCSGAPFTPAETCSYQGITIQVEGRWQADGKALAGCDYFQAAAQSALEFDQQWMSTAELNKITDGLEVWVHADNHTIICGNSSTGAGCNFGVHHIETVSNMGPLGHEILHSLDREEGAYDGKDSLSQHWNWNVQGAADGARSYIDPTTPFGTDYPIMVGSWWDSAMQLFRKQQGIFIETYCGDTGNC